MSIANATRALSLIGLVLAVGCANPKNPAGPTVGPSLAPPGGSAAAVGALKVSSFHISGWYADGAYHYFPNLTLTETSGAAAVSVDSVFFRIDDPNTTLPAGGIRYGAPKPRVPAGGTLDLMKDPGQNPFTQEIKSAAAAATIFVTVGYVDDLGNAGEVSSETTPPAIDTGSPSSTLAIASFVVSGWYDGRMYHYWPKLNLGETSGQGAVVVQKVQFTLVDSGAQGTVPPLWGPFRIDAGGTLDLVDDGYGGPYFEITNTTVNAAKVSVVISFVDESGRGSTVSGTVDVIRGS